MEELYEQLIHGTAEESERKEDRIEIKTQVKLEKEAYSNG